MKKENHFQVEVSVDNETRKAAFAKGINREVNFANVKKLLAEMGLKGYRKAEMVQVFRAEDAIANGDIVLIDINGNEITRTMRMAIISLLTGNTVFMPLLCSIVNVRNKVSVHFKFPEYS